MNLKIELFIYYFSSLYLLTLIRFGLIYNELEMAVKYIPVKERTDKYKWEVFSGVSSSQWGHD